MQLSIAKDHSPTITGSTAQVWYRSMDVYEHAILSWTYIFCLQNGFKANQANGIGSQAKPCERTRRVSSSEGRGGERRTSLATGF